MASAARAEYDLCLQRSKAHAPNEKFHYSALAIKPWRKIAIGSANGIGDPYAQNLQSTYFDANDSNYPGLGKLFKLLNAVRNRLMRVDDCFGDSPERDRFWNACRIHHYPRGSGFMAMHKDFHFPPIIAAQTGKPFYQVSVLLSCKDIDFFKSGVVYSAHNEKVDVEMVGGFGALVLFDGRTLHRVEDVDPNQVIDFSKSSGRLAVFANLYSTL